MISHESNMKFRRYRILKSKSNIFYEENYWANTQETCTGDALIDETTAAEYIRM
jgi:hypothetical protein